MALAWQRKRMKLRCPVHLQCCNHNHPAKSFKLSRLSTTPSQWPKRMADAEFENRQIEFEDRQITFAHLSQLVQSAYSPVQRRGNMVKETVQSEMNVSPRSASTNVVVESPLAISLFKGLGVLDRLLTPLILVCMIIGILIGEFVPGTQEAFDTVRFHGVSVPIAVGLIVMMWPVLTKVQYEAFPKIFSARNIWFQVSLSMIFNWILGPFVMLGLAWATLPDLPTYRTGVILVGLARCIAMVMIWNELAGGNSDYCAILVLINSILQIVLYAPYALLLINSIGGRDRQLVHVSYGDVAISVLIYMGIPIVAGVITRYTIWWLFSKEFLTTRFLPIFSPLALLGLLYTIIVIFANQGHHIVQNIGLTFRVFVPLILYFIIMWTSVFFLVLLLSRKEKYGHIFGYEMAVVQSFTAGSNNFELAIAVAVAVYGVKSDQALAATIGPLVEVPVLLSLTWVASYLGRRLQWKPIRKPDEKCGAV